MCVCVRVCVCVVCVCICLCREAVIVGRNLPVFPVFVCEDEVGCHVFFCNLPLSTRNGDSMWKSITMLFFFIQRN